ncbi:MAG: flagellar assembly protein FliW [Phycisphaerae bacterium]
MVIQTSRFGPIEIDEAKTICFARGLLGFPQYQRYVLIQQDYEATFYWLQCVEAADLAFVVTDPLLFVPDYAVPIREETRSELNLTDTEAQILVIVNKVENWLTANLQGPLVIHAGTRQGAQVVISEKKYQTRHPIMQLARAAGRSGYATKSA